MQLNPHLSVIGKCAAVFKFYDKCSAARRC